jgi:adenylate kinase family enzyme
MGAIIVISGPVGAGKTTVARELLARTPPPAAFIEGDAFWPFVAKPGHRRRASKRSRPS